VLNGITIANARSDEDTASDPGGDPGLRGIDGISRFGQGLVVEGNHIIANCVIRDCEIYGEDASDGTDGNTDDGLNGGNGGNGGSAGGAGLYIGSNVYGSGLDYYFMSEGSPVIMNCVITNCYAEAGDGGSGGNGPEGVRAGEGGVPGRVFGAGVFCDVGTSPTFIDCVITDNLAVGGVAGDGGSTTHVASLRPGWGGLTDEFRYLFWDDPADPTVYSAGDPRQYTANGAGVYVGGIGYGYNGYTEGFGFDLFIDFDDILDGPIFDFEPFEPEYPLTSATFINCTIARNITQGSISGRGGQWNGGPYLPPMHHYQVPSFGAGMYCAEDANTLVIDCRIVDNETQENPRGDGFDDYFSADHYTGYGGGVAVQGSNDINPLTTIRTSHIARNFAPVGGGMHWIDSQLDIADSNIVENVAYVGGGLHFFDSIDSIISGSLIQDNIAAFNVQVGAPDPNGAGQGPGDSILGAGGGIFSYTSDIVIRDTEIAGNAATSSGGGVYFGGHPEGLYPLLGIPALDNCLIVNNNAANDGGGVSVNWYAEPVITNCTIADNVVTNPDGLGGGLFCGYDSNTIITNSIIWDNFGATGSQIAVTGGGEYVSSPSELDITHSAVFDYQDTEGSGSEDPSDDAIREGFNLFNLPATNDGSTALVDIGFEISFFDTEYTSLYINNNGNVTFTAPLAGFNPLDLSSQIGTPIIAPFLADVDTTGVNSSTVTYAYRAGVVNGHNAFAVNWIDVGYANGNSDLLNRFQLVLIERSDRNPGDFDIEFNYDRIEWETGDNDGGTGGLGGNSARAGFSGGTGVPGTYYEFEGSGVSGTFTDDNLQTGLIHNRRNSRVPGRYVFSVINGRPVMPGIAIFAGGESIVRGWDSLGHLWDEETANIQDDPAFVTGYYYLRKDSPCVDAGEPNAVELGLDQYTTHADGTLDMDEVDLGYHYRQAAPLYELIVEIAENPDDPGTHGSVEPSSGWFVEGEEKTLVALPAEDYYVEGWYNSRGDLVSTGEEFEIVIDEDNYFTVVFKPANTVEVSGGGDALFRAVNEARNGDTLIVSPGTYSGDINPQGKKLTIVSINPDDPDVVAATVIDCGPGQRAFIFNSEDKDVTIHGFSIINGNAAGNGGAIYIGTDAAPVIKNVHIADSGSAANGGAIYIASQASPTLMNVVVESATAASNGGGVYIGPLSTPVFIECTFDNCTAAAGSGGAAFCSISSSPEFVDCMFTNNTAGLSGGAVYCNLSCSAGMSNCQFINNAVFNAGAPGDFIGSGGAIFYEFENIVDVVDCNFVDNSARSGGAVFFHGDTTGTFHHNLLSSNNAGEDGGAMFVNRTTSLAITDCAVVENTAIRGGGLYSIGSVGNVISGCSFRDNLADRALFAPTDPNGVVVPGPAPVATTEGSISGFGGGIFLFAEDTLVVDSAFSMNLAGNAGGGLYLGGSTDSLIPAVSPELKNCLVVSNTAGRAGGGVACDWYVEPVIANCTIADNGTTNYGGGLVVSYDSKVSVVDSIIWANFAVDGSQIAVINDNEFDSSETSLDISYSDVGPLPDPNDLLVDPGEQLDVEPTADPFEMADVLLGEGIRIIGNPVYSGADIAAGTFTGGIAAGIGIESGIILTNGRAELAEAPNTSDFTSQVNNYPGDVDLDNLIGGFFFFNYTNDATVLEFDFETEGGDLFFNYVFASEEYNEFANSLFNDAFAFFLDGVNIALIPGTNTPVSINSINGGNPFGFFANNPELYNNNDLSDGGPFFDIEYDGFTNVLTAKATDLSPGVHHIKLVIADVGDGALDSAVFLQAGSFSAKPTFSPPVYVEDNCVLNGEARFDFVPLAHRWDPNDFIIADDPLFVGDDSLYGGEDPLLFVGGYMLSHLWAEQPADSNCIDFGHVSAEEAGLSGYTTSTNQVPDANSMVDLGYHYRPFERARYELIVDIDPGSVDGPHGTVVITPAPDPVTGLIKAGTLVTVTAVPDPGYRVREWIGVDDSPAWQEPSVTLVMDADTAIAVKFEVDARRNLLVPTAYETIEQAVAAASPGDTIIVDPGVHYITSPDGINFNGKAIKLMSTDPDNEAIVAQTIIDCQGTRYRTKRAFHFFNGEGPDAIVTGFTIRNGFYHGALGGSGVVPGVPIDPGEDPPQRFTAPGGEDAIGDGYGGAILCENESSPTFEHCVITNCTVTGGYGGDGMDGLDDFYNNNSDGQWGGIGGSGSGNGYGGAIACLRLSNPILRNCIFRNNTAMGGCGGDGGDGGSGNDAGAGGDGGYASGVGMGGAIYAENNSNPVVVNCVFENNVARWGVVGRGGARGQGDDGDPAAFAGFDGGYYNNWFYFWDLTNLFGISYNWDTVAGGAAYYAVGSHPRFEDCRFVGNSAYEISPYYGYFGVVGDDRYDREIPVYTIGGAIYADRLNTVTLERCDFDGNLGGAVYCESENSINIVDCLFRNNHSLEQADYENPGYYGTYYYGWYYYSWYYYGSYYQGDNRTAPGGALYIGPDSTAGVVGSDFRNNEAFNGGAVNTKSSVGFTDCMFNANTAGAYGGAVDAYQNIDPNRVVIELDFDNCTFANNSAAWGGAVHAHDFDASDIRNSQFTNNSAQGQRASGGAIAFYGGDNVLTQNITNCLFTGNTATVRGGAVSCSIFTAPVLVNCTFSNNSAGAAGGAIGCDWMSSFAVKNSIFDNCSRHAIAEEDSNSSLIDYNLFHNNPDGDYGIYNTVPDPETGLFGYDFISESAGSEIGTGNIVDDPLFVSGPLGDYYLSQIAGGQPVDSPAVDHGTSTVDELGLTGLTTCTLDTGSGYPDTDPVDLGFHWRNTRDPENPLLTYSLTARVEGGHGTVEPTSGTYYAGTLVKLTAVPEPDYRVDSWSGGTIDDQSRANINYVVMGSDKEIVVTFDQPRVLVVGSEGKYTSIQRAIDDAEDGDIVMLQTGEWVPPYPFGSLDFWEKDITLTSMNPDDENVVANTILSGYEFSFSNVGPGTVIDGLTIRWARMSLYGSSPIIRNTTFLECNWLGADGFSDDNMDGGNGTSVFGGAIQMYNSSPQILNCTFDSCSVTGGDGGDGADGDANAGHPEGWDGGWAGRAYGGAVYAAWKSNPVFRDCKFNNCFVQGGNGGDGGDGDNAPGGRGGNWMWSPMIEQSLYWLWWDGWEWGDKFGDYGWFYWSGWYDVDDEWYLNYVYDPYDAYYDYWRYTGLGGAFYCEADCAPKFYHCTFTNNSAFGGDCGVGGDGTGPSSNMDIETAGGAIYFAYDCSPEFYDCLIRNNTADTTTVDEPDDYFVSFGGGIGFDTGCTPRFVNCDIQYNQACEGGGMYWVDAHPEIIDCNFVGNVAYHGGGMYSTHATGEITGTFFTANLASVASGADLGGADPNGAGGSGATFTHSVFGRGGGYYTISSLVDISDSVFRENQALASGGGIFFVGSDQDNVISPVLKNCLIARNTAGRDGGGISINWFAEPEIANCTISDNVVTGALGVGFGYGGGVYVGYNGGAYISDSIIWDNAGATGAQIAVTNADPYGPRASEVTVVYSDVGPPYEPNAFDDLLLLADGGQEGTGDAAATSVDDGSASVLVDARTIYDAFDSGDETVRVIVTLRDFTDMRKATDWDSPISSGLIRQAIADRQARVLATLAPEQFTLTHRYENIAGFAGEITRDGLEKLLADPMVEHIEPDREVYPMLAQAIPLANALAARQAYDGTGISVAIVDTGIDYRHPRLGGGGFPNNKVIGGYDTAMNDADPIPVPNPVGNEAHGTACAGIAAGDLGMVGDYIGGVAFGAKLYALKIADDAGVMTLAAAVAAWDWCVTNKNNDPANPIMVVSNSWGFAGLPFNDSAAADAFAPALTAVADTLNQAGITILAASGNDGFAGVGISHPSAMSNVISVGAVYDTTDQVTPYSNTADLLDILAPADPVYTTDIIGLAGYDVGDYYPYFNGTSSACPFAAGCVASIQAAALDKTSRYLTPGEIRNLLVSTGVPITDTKVAITKPRVNLGAAIANLTSLPIYVDEGCILHGWDPNDQEWAPDTFNIMEDPQIVGDYFLSEIDAGQLYDSPCVDYIYNVEQGRMAEDFFDFDQYTYTTRSDAEADTAALNVGYHHRPFEMERYRLDYLVIVDPFMLPGYDPVISPYDPNGLIYDQLTQVRLTVSPPPPPGYHCVWTGTDDDLRHEPNNVVTMDDDKIVTVEFESIGYVLEATVVVDANILPDFQADITLDPPGGVYYPGTVVEVKVTPPPEGFQVRWIGADDGSVVEPNNFVTMDSDKEVIAAYEPVRTDYYAIIVGIADYIALGSDLLYPAHDASQFYQKLLKAPNWHEENMYLLVDEQATRGEIRLALDDLSDRIDHDDVFVFYFAGQGITGPDVFPLDEIDDLDEYLVTYAMSNIRDDELNEWMAELATDNYVVLLDTNFSGGHIDAIGGSFAARGMGDAVPAQGDSFADDLLATAGAGQPGPSDLNQNPTGVVITACSNDQFALEVPELRHGLFTYFLLQAVDGRADWEGNDNQWVSAEEAYAYLGQRVVSYVEDAIDAGLLAPGTEQGPRMYDADPDNDIEMLIVEPKDSDPVTWYVPGDTETIQEAIELAKDGDVIILAANTYRGGGLIIDKAITITSTNPDDPDIVAATIIDAADYLRRGVYFTSNTGPDTVLNGITLTHSNQALFVVDAADGEDGDSIGGGGLFIGSGASPTIKNCVIRDFTLIAGNGGAGVELVNGGDGGDGGFAAGGGVYCATGSAPTFINTVIDNCHVFGGNGGNGAPANVFESGGRGGWGGWARGGGVYIAEDAAPTFTECTITNCTATGGNGGNGGDSATFLGFDVAGGYGGNWSSDFYAPWQVWGYEGDYRFYSGYGAGVYCAGDSSPRFINCTITGNSTQGGISGLGGTMPAGLDRQEPVEAYEIPSYGGGVYCAADSDVELKGCTIAGNVAPKPGANYVLDPVLGHGGGIAFEGTSSLKLTDCLISQNESSVGGGIYWFDDEPLIVDCNVMGNIAYQGGGMYGMRGAAVIKGGSVHDNFAGSMATDTIDAIGQGGGIHLSSVAADITDLHVYDNQSNASGGGIFVTGMEPTPNTIGNCLLVNNKAGRDGGGISINWFARTTLSNCTFANNWATGYFGFLDPNSTLDTAVDPNGIPSAGGGTGTTEPADFAAVGGGLYCGYESTVVVTDSIFNGNFAPNGRQLAVGTGFEFDPRPAALTISFSNVQGGRPEPATLVEEGCVLNWSDNILDDPRFVAGPLGDFYLSQVAAGQSVDSPCVDAGSDLASALGMDKYTTRSDDSFENFDTGVVDMGFHYPLKLTMAACRVCDLVFDGLIDIRDMAVLADNWLSLDECAESGWCDGADINTDTEVDFADFVIFASCWFVEDLLPPIPDPAEWDIEPQALVAGNGVVEMSAKTALDAWWSDQVEYYFECLTDPAYSSGWRQGYDPADTATYVENPEYYTVSGLVADGQTEYTFRVRVRDGRGNMTAWSAPMTVIPGHEVDPPLPNPAMWYGDDVDGDGVLDVDVNLDGIPDGMPYAISGTALRMIATVGTDMSPFDDGSLEYYFRYTDPTGEFDGAGDGYDSGWQQSHDPDAPNYTPTPHIFEPDNLTPLVNYYYRVRVRDRFGNETEESVVAVGTPDPAVVDFNPPQPDPPLWQDAPQEIRYVDPVTQEVSWWHWMSVQPVADAEGNGEEYYFECLTNDAFSGGWFNALNVSIQPDGLPAAGPEVYYVEVGAPGMKLKYVVRTRDQSPNQNVSSDSVPLTVP